MAKKSTKQNRPKTPNKLMQTLGNEKFTFALGIILLFCTLYVTLALISFLFTGAEDVSIISNSVLSEAEMSKNIQNWTGLRGAKLAEVIVNNYLGLSSFAVLVFPFALSMSLIKVPVMKLWRAFLFPILFVVWAPIMLQFFFGSFMANSFYSIGGLYGEFITSYLVTNVGIPGTLFIVIGAFLVFSVFAFSATIPAIRSLLIKKHTNEEEESECENEENEVVRIGDDIVNPDWVEEADKDDNSLTEENEEENENTIEIVSVEPEVTDNDVSIEVISTDVTDEYSLDIEPEDEQKSEPNQVVISVEESVEDKKEPKDEVSVVSVEAVQNDEIDENLKPYDPTLDLSYYKYPTLDLLKEYPKQEDKLSDEEKKANQMKIITTLKNFGIGVKTIYETIGPTITLYEIVPENGVRISKIRNLEDDIMLSLSAIGIRIIAPMPGKGTIGIEVPNSNPKIVSMHGSIASKKFQESQFELPVALGRTITNEVFTFDLAKMPHLLVAGATGQGKSVGLNAIITSLLYKKHPSQLKMVLIDPKKVEFSVFSNIENHFLAKIPDTDEAVITDTSKVVQTLNSLCKEMDMRYDLLKSAGTRNIKEYNKKFIERKLNPLKGHKYLPYIVVVVDEFGDLIMTAGKEVELPIARIAQLARAVGMHMILATQRPSVNIITGVIKANFPARIAFRVSSGVDSKTILDRPGAQQLIGRGDLLFAQGEAPVRVQCAFVDTPEVEEIVSYISQQQGYPTAFILPEPDVAESDADLSGVDLAKRDPYFEEVARYVVNSQIGSTSNIQRKFEIGFNRAGRIMDQLEVAGVVGAAKGSKPRDVLIQTEFELDQMFNSL